MFAGQAGLLQKAHFPANRRPQQLQNVTLVLGALQQHCKAHSKQDVASTWQPDDLVDGKREPTLFFLWALFVNFQVRKVHSMGILLAIRC